MRTAPVVPARLAYTADGVPASADYGDVYHPAAGAAQQARHVFLAGNGLPARWAGRERFVVLETGFGLGNNFLATWDAWRQDPARCERLVFVSLEKHPLDLDDLRRAHAGSPWPDLAAQLLDAWPLATPNLHLRRFEDGRVALLLAFGNAQDLVPQLLAQVDAFYLDGFAPAVNPALWDAALLQRLGRLAAPGATAATWSAARVLREALSAAGFEVALAPGSGGKRDITLARHAPRYRPPLPPGGLQPHAGAREALVVGAGLAGCAAAWALAGQGWRCTVLERADGVAAATSGQAAGLFHGGFQADDGPHARLLRAAALQAQALVQPWIASGRLRGDCGGLLRVERRLDGAHAAALLARQGLPTAYLRWMERDEARAATGLALDHGGWWYAGGGWLAPRDLARCLLEDSGAALRTGVQVERLRRADGLWQALAADGRVLAAAPVVVLANALDAQRLAGDVPLGLAALRGQLSRVALDPALPQTRVPVSGDGYLLPPLDGAVLFGASSRREAGPDGPSEAEHRDNLAQMARLAGGDASTWAALPWSGRVGWRATTADRLPLIGALPDLAASAAARGADRLRLLPRQRDADGGLYVYTGLGSRGITWAVLGAQLLASWVSGAPCPVEARLRDALDPARVLLRARQRPQ